MTDWKPFPKQEQALVSTAFELLYGGARGGAKTECGIVWLLYPIANPRYRALVIRKNYTDLKDWVDRAAYLYSGTKAVFTAGEITFPSGAKIILGHLSDDNAYMKYQGHEYQRMLIEELTQIPTEELYLKLIASCRSTIDIEPRIFTTANPGGPGHRWVKKRFVDPALPGHKFQDSVSGRTRIYIPATVDDNPVLQEKDPDYVKFLDSLPEDLRKQWREGSWDNMKVKGSYYSDDTQNAGDEHRICSLQPVPNVPIHTFWDIGLNDTQVCWFVQFVGKEIRFVDLFFDSDKPYSYYITMLREREIERRWKYAKVRLPHDGTKRSASNMKSFKDELEAAGFEVEITPRTMDKSSTGIMSDINQSRAMFPRCWFDAERCQKGIEALTDYHKEWDAERQTYNDKPFHDWTSNFADALQQVAVNLKDLEGEKESDFDSAFQKYLGKTY